MDNEYLKRIYGLLESGATLGTGAVSGLVGLPYGLYKGVTSGAYGTPEAPRIAAREAQQFMERNTYQPRTAEGQANLQQLAGLLEASKLPPVMPEASLLAAIPKQAYAAQAERAGMAAEKAIAPVVTRTMDRGGLPAQLLGDLSQGAVSRVVPVDVAKRIDMPVNLPQSKEFLKAVENEPSAQITDQGLLMNLKRLQTPEQSMAESVRTGVFYLPEGQAANLKHYKGKTGYGGSEAIEGETLYKNPLFVKGATGGKAPEAAYDQLVGKGAYQQMRDDVLKSYSYNANQSQKVEAVQGLLEKYNGLDSDDAYNMAYNIVSNSKGGNTLPYAIQENIVAHKVRDAGHDAVLGYGKGRGDKGEFFSEVFDVREYAYPNAYGDYELMPEFAGKVSDKPVGGLLGQSKAAEATDLLSYRGSHTAPGPDFGAPLHDLTGGGQMYPADVYSSKAAQYYGGGVPYDQKAFNIAQSFKDKPNATVTIYRAVPKEISNSEKLADIEKQMAAYMKRGTLPKDAENFSNGSKWYDWAYDQREALKNMPDEPKAEIGINSGDWVTLTKEYAKDHGESALKGQYKILSKKVKAKDIWTNADSIHEFGYHPSE